MDTHGPETFHRHTLLQELGGHKHTHTYAHTTALAGPSCSVRSGGRHFADDESHVCGS